MWFAFVCGFSQWQADSDGDSTDPDVGPLRTAIFNWKLLAMPFNKRKIFATKPSPGFMGCEPKLLNVQHVLTC